MVVVVETMTKTIGKRQEEGRGNWKNRSEVWNEEGS